MCPSVFVTFVWENNVVNPESIFGETMHCTNDIIIQIRSGITQPPNRPCQFGRKPSNRSFSPKECNIAKYINFPRQSSLDDYEDVSFEISEVDSALKESCKTDFLWILLKAVDKTISDWTGFNYFINQSDDS